MKRRDRKRLKRKAPKLYQAIVAFERGDKPPLSKFRWQWWGPR